MSAPVHMLLCVLIPLMAPLAPPAAVDQRAVWLKSEASVIRSIDPADEDFEDLEPLKAAIGSARIVMLGEQSHGDGATFMAKARLVKFLHQKMGFEVLAWESGLFDCTYADAAFKRGESAASAWENGLFGIWALSKEAMRAVEYSRATYDTPRPLVMAGFDCQFTSANGQKQCGPFVESFFDAADPALLDKAHRDAMNGLIAWLAKIGEAGTRPDPAAMMTAVEELAALCDSKKDVLAKVHDARKILFARQVLLNMVAFARANAPASGSAGTAPGARWDSLNARDKAMADSLALLANSQYPDKKIVVWAASMHLLRNAPNIRLEKGPSYEGARPMGDHAYKQFGDQIYSIMFTAARGSMGIAWGQENGLPPVVPGSLEDVFTQVGAENVFLDLRAHRNASGLDPDAWLNQSVIARPLGYADAKGVWPKSFDAVFFTRTMFRSHHARQ